MTLLSRFKSHNDIAAYHREMRVPVVPGLRFSRDGLIHFKGQTLPVLGSTARIEISGSVNRVRGVVVAKRVDDRSIWLIIDGPNGTFQVPINRPFTENQARKIVNHINVANKGKATS